MVSRGIKLPLGTYWGDGLLGSMAAHNLDALTEPWDNGRVVGVAAATLKFPVLSPLKLDDVRRQFRRKIRQMRGRIQTAAITNIIYRAGYEGLPNDADEMVKNHHLAVYGPPRVSLLDQIFQILAVREIQSVSRNEQGSFVPHRVLLI